MSWKNNAINLCICPVCGGRLFRYGPNRRMNNGMAPCCLGCISLERHRIIYNCYKAFPPEYLNWRSCLHFAPDRSIIPEWFGTYEASEYGTANSLDIQAIDRPSASYDWIICNHVLEHVPKDALAMSEMLRVIKPEGIIQFSIPSPLLETRTKDWGKPDPVMHYHYRGYGADFLDRFTGLLSDSNMVPVIGVDPVTGSKDVMFFVSKSPMALRELREILMNGSG